MLEDAWKNFRYHLDSEEQTIDFARCFSLLLKPSDVVALHGDLGAGKSVLARAMMRSLGVREQVMPSPTFSIIQEYEARGCRVAHMDWYRLHGAEELEIIGVRDYFRPPWICLIEWAERAPSLLPETTLHLHMMTAGDQPTCRVVEGRVPVSRGWKGWNG
ncbi:MAG: tRNA (adenosine(37)-N6)-threonylcarbamoyltransferase complex ATPase subunit type 1 TsaE [Zetaproteobacteria bacterium]|nr:MAG: tRNA (adenosine(37)-N6)-threonylcarbamoyltransferase complex ATPase subunit type 1 TsaE [Zetaproteobacteria bacterium]